MVTLKELSDKGSKFVATDATNKNDVYGGKVVGCSGGIKLIRAKDATGRDVIVYVLKEV